MKLKGNFQHDNAAKYELKQENILITESYNHLIIESNDIITSIADTTITISANTPGDILVDDFTATLNQKLAAADLIPTTAVTITIDYTVIELFTIALAGWLFSSLADSLKKDFFFSS